MIFHTTAPWRTPYAESSPFNILPPPMGRLVESVNASGESVLGVAFGKWKAAMSEAEQLFGMAESWLERLSIARLVTELHIARVLPVDSYSRDTAVRLHGTTYCLGLRTSEIYVVEEVFRHKMYDRSGDFLAKEGWVVFDIGANIGVVSVLQARRHAQVYAFEPNPDCYRRLLKTITANGLEAKIHPFNLALGNVVGTGKMQVEKGGTTGGTVIAGDEGSPTNASVSITTLDRIVPALNVPQIDLLKIDVEGAEVDVLRGAVQTLLLTKRIMLEYHSRALLERAELILKPYGFERDVLVEYYPEDLALNQEEVGITYYSKPIRARS
jgi:FkbM family methyltransferase